MSLRAGDAYDPDYLLDCIMELDERIDRIEARERRFAALDPIPARTVWARHWWNIRLMDRLNRRRTPDATRIQKCKADTEEWLEDIRAAEKYWAAAADAKP